jgi:hypothetical protein
LFRGARAFEVNIIDLLVVEVLRVFEPRVYHLMAAAKTVLTSGARAERGRVPAELQAIFDAATEAHRENVTELVKLLFPPIEAALGGPTYDDGFRQRWREELRVCSDDVFDRYFQLGIPEGDLSESEFRELVDATADYATFVEKFETIRFRGLLDSMLGRLDNHAPQLPIQNSQPLIRALMHLGENLPDRSGFFALTSDIQVLRIVVRLLEQEEAVRQRGKIVLSSMRETDGLLIPAIIIANDDHIRSKEGNSTRAKSFDDDQFAEAKALWIDRVKHIAEHDPERLLRNKKLLYMLYRWKDWATADGPDIWLPRLVNGRKRTLDFLTSVAQLSNTYSTGDHVSRQHTFIRLSDVEQFISCDVLARHIDADTIDLASVDASQLKALEAFRDALKRRAEGKSDDSLFDR